MGLSSDLISQFVKVTKDDKIEKKEAIVYGTTVDYNGTTYVKLDGSELLTPISTTADVKPDERVTVMIKDHTATITGNMSSPAARTDDVKDTANQINEFEIVMAHKVTSEELEAITATIESLRAKTAHFNNMEAVNAAINSLEAKYATLTNVSAKDIEALNADIENLKVKFGEFTDISTEDLEAIYADIGMLSAYTADFTYVSADVLQAIKANIKTLDVEKLSAKDADIKYANIDFSNIGEAAIEYFYSKSGLIEDIIISEGKITGNLIGVTIKGDLIEAGTLVADKLVVKGSNGLYYKLNTDGVTTETEQTDYNSLNGSVITAKSITATKISVDDLVAFDATIGGFNITDSAIYSGVKSSADNDTRGVYLDKEGQVAFGDSTDYLRYYKDTDGNYILEIAASRISFGTDKKTIEEAIDSGDMMIRKTTAEQIASVVQDCEKFVLSAVKTRVDTSSYEEFRKTVEAKFKILSDEISMNFNSTTEQITDVDGDLQSFLTRFSKFIRFTGDTAITIGSGNSAITLEIDNETGIVFKKNGVQFGWWDGVDFHTGNIVVEVNERAQFGNFAFVPRSDGSLSFLKVGG